MWDDPRDDRLALERDLIKWADALRQVAADVSRPASAASLARVIERMDQEVIHYRKVIGFTVEGDEGVPPGFWLHDILRLSVRHFLVRLDDPVDRQAHFAEATGAFAHA